MKKTIKTIMAIVLVVLTLTTVSTTAFAATTTVTEKQFASWRGNGSASGRGADDVTIAIEKKQSVTFSATNVLTVDPNTSAKKITSKAYFRQYHWYGYSTLLSLTLANEKSVNNTGSSAKTVKLSKSGSTKTTETGEYYCVGTTSGASSAFYNDYTFKVAYGVG